MEYSPTFTIKINQMLVIIPLCIVWAYMHSFVADVLLSTILNHHETTIMECHKVVFFPGPNVYALEIKEIILKNGASNLEDDKPQNRRTVVGKPTYTLR